MFNNFFGVLDKPVSEENEYIMKAIMRSFSLLQDKVIPFLNVTLPKLTEKLQMICKNPSKPHFNHYLFETFSLAIRYTKFKKTNFCNCLYLNSF